jgi:hypothetical protein
MWGISKCDATIQILYSTTGCRSRVSMFNYSQIVLEMTADRIIMRV